MHALTGANGAGKSTLMAVLCGTHAHYEGEVVINNQSVSIRSPRDAKQLGIHLVQQEVDVALVPGLSIAENIMLDRLAEPGIAFRWGGCASWRARRWLSLTSASTYAAPSTAVRWRKNSKSCWPARCRITAAFLSSMNRPRRWTKTKASACLRWFAVCSGRALVSCLSRTAFMN